jgi:hypothetical protein
MACSSFRGYTILETLGDLGDFIGGIAVVVTRSSSSSAAARSMAAATATCRSSSLQ